MSHLFYSPEAKAATEKARFIQDMGRSIVLHWPRLKGWQRRRRMRIVIRHAEALADVPRAVFDDPVAYFEARAADATIGELRRLIVPEVEASTAAASTTGAVCQALARIA